MTYYGGKELAAAFKTVRDNTIKIAEEIPEEKYGFRATPETRTIAQTLAHMAMSSNFQHYVHGNKIADMTQVPFAELFQKSMAEESRPRTKAETIALLKDEGDKFVAFLESLPESFLAETVTFPAGMQPPVKTRFEMLLGSKEHEMHHRGQLMVLQRMVGITPHLTRQMQARFAQIAAASQAGQRA